MFGLPLLWMEIEAIGDLPKPELPEGFAIRPFRPGDEDALLRVYATCGLGLDTLEDVEALLDDPQMKSRDRLLVLERGDTLVGTAAGRDSPYVAGSSELHMVGILPELRGLGLGKALTLAVLENEAALGYGRQVLFSEESRLAAVAAYLSLGYRPVYQHPSDPGRWRAIARRLGRPGLRDVARRGTEWSAGERLRAEAVLALRAIRRGVGVLLGRA